MIPYNPLFVGIVHRIPRLQQQPLSMVFAELAVLSIFEHPEGLAGVVFLGICFRSEGR